MATPRKESPQEAGTALLVGVKARHTVFYETPLDYLLTQIGAEAVVLAGQVTERCILYSALDASPHRKAPTTNLNRVGRL